MNATTKTRKHEETHEEENVFFSRLRVFVVAFVFIMRGRVVFAIARNSLRQVAVLQEGRLPSA